MEPVYPSHPHTMLPNGNPCHQDCSDMVEKQIKDVLSEIHKTVTVDTVVFELGNDATIQDECPSVNTSDLERMDQTFTHKFLVTIVTKCRRENESPNCIEEVSTPSGNTEVVPGVIEVEDLNDVSMLINDPANFTAIDSLEKLTEENICLDVSFTDQDYQSIFSDMDNTRQSEYFVVGQLGCNIKSEAYDGMGSYPLTDNELQQTISQQLEKPESSVLISIPDFSVHVTATDEADCPQQQQQSNEISSSSNCESAVVSASSFRKTTVTPKLTLKSLSPVASCGFNYVNGSGHVNFPAVSSLIPVVGSETKSIIKERTQKKGRLQRTRVIRPRPTLLPRNTTSTFSSADISSQNSCVSSGKSAPPLNAVAQLPSQTSTDMSTRIPEGHTCRSYIILEGLIRVRQRIRQEKKAKSQSGDSNASAAATQEKAKFFCPICYKEYRSANGIKYHATTAHKEEWEKVALHCRHCGKSYPNRYGLAAHEKAHNIRYEAEVLTRAEDQDQSLVVVGNNDK